MRMPAVGAGVQFAPNASCCVAAVKNRVARPVLQGARLVMKSIVVAVWELAKRAGSVSARRASMKAKGVRTAMKKELKMKNETRRLKTALRFSPVAWAKLLFLRDAGTTEIAAFGISPTDDLLFVEDVALVRQTCTWATVELDDNAVADFFDDQVDRGRKPETFARHWLHTHPANSAEPSGTDEETFARVFGRSEWAVMFILARGGETYARLRYNVGPGAEFKLPVEVEFGCPFLGTDFDAWQEQFQAKVCLPPALVAQKQSRSELVPSKSNGPFMDEWYSDAWEDYLEFERTQWEAEHGSFNSH
jgi:hypothetical protein